MLGSCTCGNQDATAIVPHTPSTVDGIGSRDYDVLADGHALKLHLLLLPDGKLEDVVVTTAPK